MTSHQLAHLLLAHPDVRVLVDGYEGQEDDVAHVCLGFCTLDVSPNDWVGLHQMAHGGDVACVVIRREPVHEDAAIHALSCGVSVVVWP